MKVSAIESNNQRRSCLFPMAEGALVGTAAGYVLKGSYPVTSQEKETPAYKRVMKEIEEKRNVFGPENEAWLERIKAKSKLSPAEDTFVKMYDGMKEGDKIDFGYQKLWQKYASLRKNDPASAQEFRRLMHDARNEVDRTVQRSIEGYNSATKAIRPLSFFLIGGAVAGAFIALVHDILRTDVKQA